MSLLGLNGFEYFLAAGLGRDGGGGWGPTTHSGDVLGLTGYTLGDVEFGGGQTDGIPDHLLHHFNIHQVRGVLQNAEGTCTCIKTQKVGLNNLFITPNLYVI